MAATGTALYVFVFGYLVYFTVAFRVRPSDPPDAIGVQVHDNHKLEFWWTLIPALFVVLLFRGRQRAESVRNHARAAEWARRPSNRPSVRLYVSLSANQRRDQQRDASAGGRSGHPESDVVGRDSLVLGAGDAPKERYRTRLGNGDSIHPPVDRALQDHLHPVLRRLAQSNEQAGARHRRQGDVRPVVPRLASPQRAREQRTAGGRRRGGSARRRIGGRRADVVLTKCSACHAVGPFNQKIVGPGLKGVLHDPTHPDLVNGRPATPANAAKILQSGYTGSIGTMPNATTNGLSDRRHRGSGRVLDR